MSTVNILIRFLIVTNTQQPPQQQHVPLQQQTSLDAEPYSLRQFGINIEQTYNNSPIQAPSNNMPQQYQPMQAQQNLSPMMLPTNPADSFLFGLSDLSFSTPYQPAMNYDALPITNDTNNYPIQQVSPQQGMLDQTVFRNRPDNPFWSVPSSIELDDWTAYLLPQQPITSTSNQQQRGWNSPGWV